MEIILTLKTDQTMGKGTTKGKTLPQRIHEAIEAHNEEHDAGITLETMQFKRTPEEEAEIEERKQSGDLVPIEDYFASLKDNEPQMTTEEAEGHLEGVDIPEFASRDKVVEFMRKMPNEEMISHLIYSIGQWRESDEEN